MPGPYRNVVHRKMLAPWYDTETACFISIAALMMILGFAVIGITVAYGDVAFHAFGWVPISLAFMSLTVIVSISIRLIKRYLYRFQHRYLKDFSRDAL